MGLLDRLIAQIAESGPISVAQYMTACLHDPLDGYYATRPALGAAGDFITAPLVSQMFGELIGLWAVEAWVRMGRPAPVRLVEMGPGDGTLMEDLLRAARLVPDFLAAAEVWLVETSPPLRGLQQARLGPVPNWATSLAEVPAGAPLLLIANELLDCLPCHQYVCVRGGWAERRVGIDGDGHLAFGLTGVPFQRPGAALGSVLEQAPAQEALGTELGDRIAVDGGAALLIDYGRSEPGYGDTLQALRRHQKEGPLENPGQADLTVHADFPAVLAAAAAAGAATAPILTQGAFLTRLGILERTEVLRRARPDQGEVLDRQRERLVSPHQMGELFKVACIHSPGLVPPGFET